MEAFLDGRECGDKRKDILERNILPKDHQVLFVVRRLEFAVSGKQKRTVVINGRAFSGQGLVHGPRLLMLDEPTNGLDPPARKRMLDLVTDIRDRGETYILLSSHLLRDVESVCDEVLILKEGRIAASCDLEAERRANRSFVEVELQTPHDGFAQELTDLGCELAVHDGGRFKLVLPDTLSVRDLYTLAGRLGVGIRHLDLKRDSLQDIFLRAMEGDNGGL